MDKLANVVYTYNQQTKTTQKQIPKKPPPPTPSSGDSLINEKNSPLDQAPALPPRPLNQFNPLLQQFRPPLLAHLQHPLPSAQQPIREQAKVLYAYKANNEDELTIQVGDIISVLDKKIEDAGWWRGELNGKIGVFPDNFVELIEPSQQSESWQHLNKASIASLPNQYTIPTQNTAKLKSVFAGTPKGFSKELEENLEKHNNQVAFLSLKRNKVHQQMSLPTDTITDTEKMKEVGTNPDSASTKLNHITANRAKGPTRRPPSNVLSKKPLGEQQEIKAETNGQVLEESANIRETPSEIAELRQEVKQLQENTIPELKDGIEAMRQELRDCQSAIEIQRKYIKELVNNLADERKKIAAMQAELDKDN